MNLFKIFDIFKKGEPGFADDFWYGALGQETDTGLKITPANAMQVSAVFACVRVLSETIASLPLKIYKKKPDGTREEARQHPIADLIAYRPNSWQTSFEFREMMQMQLELFGNAYAQLIPGPRGYVHEIIPIHSDFVRPEIVRRGVIRYQVSDINGSNQRVLLAHEMFHMRGPSLDGITGLSPIMCTKNAIALAKATEKHGSRLFRNNANPGGVLSMPGNLSLEAQERVRTSWIQSHAGTENSNKTAVLEGGMSWTPISMSSEDSQFLQTRQYQVTEIARIFRVPPHMIGDLSKSSFNNIEQQAIDFVRHSIRPRLVRWEQAISRDMILSPDIYYPQFKVDALLRGDTKARFEGYSKAINDGWMTRNEVRALENLNPLEGLDEPIQPLNMGGVGEESEPKEEKVEEKEDE